MLSFCLKCRKNRERKNPQVVKKKKWKNNAFMKCAVCDSKNSKFIKEY